jgi:uncharacterized protein YbjQ (UPF0145 family)
MDGPPGPSGAAAGPAGAAGTAGGPDGDVPEAAGRRFGSGAWSSGLSVVDFASCASMGMDPVGFVQGYAVMQWAWYTGSYYGGLGGLGGPPVAARGQYSEAWQCPHGFVGGEHRMYGFNYQQTWLEANWANGWSLAYHRMVEEAVALRAHGVIGVVDNMHHLPGTGAAEFQIRGTAVVVPGATPPPAPFTTFLAGQRLVKLIEAGFVPVSVAAALSSVQMVGYCMTHYQLAGTAGGTWSGGISGVNSITQVSRAQEAARHLARERIRGQLGGDTLHGATLEQFDHEVGEGDMNIQCIIKGTRVRQFKDFDPLPEAEPVVRLT